MKTTVVVPPQAEGAPVLLLLICRLHPPVAVADDNHELNCSLTAYAIWHEATILLVGQFITKGAELPTQKVADVVAELPHASEAVKVTVMQPQVGSVIWQLLDHVILLQASEATAPPCDASHELNPLWHEERQPTVSFLAAVVMVSEPVTQNEADVVEVFPHLSVAVNVTSTQPQAGAETWPPLLDHDTVPQLAVAEAPALEASHALNSVLTLPEQLTEVLWAGVLITGGVVPLTFMAASVVAVFPQASVAVKVMETDELQAAGKEPLKLFDQLTFPQLAVAVAPP